MLINYEVQKDIVTHGRSAALSIFNLFSKSGDIIKQDEPYEEVLLKVAKGYIQCDAQKNNFNFSLSTKARSESWLQSGTDSLALIPGQKFKKLKNGKIKNKRHRFISWQLMRGETCVAALEYNKEGPLIYLLNELSEKEKLVIAAFFLFQSTK
ncbi:MAG: hypothetical protein ABIT58_07715 [Ferruginibacter sp.]